MSDILDPTATAARGRFRGGESRDRRTVMIAPLATM